MSGALSRAIAAAAFLAAAAPACSTSRPATATAPAEADDCTLQTPLRPGVPGSPGHLIASAVNPNGASELAALMRAFVDELRAARAAVASGTKVAPLWPRHRKMRCAWPTAASDRNARFDALAVVYLENVKAFDAAPSATTYDGVVGGCRGCHEVTCGGPLETIKGLERAPDLPLR